ncbi:hypothetical protein H2199_000443 [Coniosporium tulheliwenetii]|uniref:Uncharacterized protein n=1 Tax=Coniosporium tulheliwenetii TaxID=3383036 RepID=A0ACC2ZQ42_9PEZI|nr:hypothetical protein H2199_000443 [Cladosporium sp. JES 115]
MAPPGGRSSVLADFVGTPSKRHETLSGGNGNVSEKAHRRAHSVSSQSTVRQEGAGLGEDASTDGEPSGDDEDSSDEPDEEEEESEDPERSAPSGGSGLGKGKRPAIRAGHVYENDQESSNSIIRGAGLQHSNTAASQHRPRTKKRTYSNVSTNSVLTVANDDEMERSSSIYPRKKIVRKVSNNATGLLAFERPHPGAVDRNDDDEAIEISDDDEEVYKGVDQISDSEEDDPDVEKLKEKMIIESEADIFTPSFYSGIPDNVMDFAPFGEESFLDGFGLGDTAMGLNDAHLLSNHDAYFDITSPDKAQSEGSSRRVRFDDNIRYSDETSCTCSGDETDDFPDLLLDQASLAPGFRSMIENDGDTDFGGAAASDGENSYWDFTEERDYEGIGSASPDSDMESSGYETDDGDTTDEELPPSATVRHPSALLRRRPSSSVTDKTATPKPFPRKNGPATPSRQKGPVMGSWAVDPTKAICVLDPVAKRLVVIPSTTARNNMLSLNGSSASSVADGSPRTSSQPYPAEESDFSERSLQSPVGLNVVLGGVFGMDPRDGIFDSFIPQQTFPPQNSTGPWTRVNPDGTFLPVTFEEDEDDDDDDGEANLNLYDLLEFGDDDTDEDMADDDGLASPATSTLTHPAATTAKPVEDLNQRNASHTLLEHFDRVPVGAFRSNQHKYRDISRLPQHPAMRASIHQPLRKGKSAKSTITPIRKRKTSNAAGTQASPLARKALTKPHGAGHRRTQSPA